MADKAGLQPATTAPRQCAACGSCLEDWATARIMGKHDVRYYRCGGCGMVRTEQPYWLAEAYSDPIAATDVGLVARNYRLARISSALIPVFFNGSGRFLDYAGGYGLFARLMRDAGFDFFWHDRYCRNLFAAGFEAALPPGEPFELMTAFEVLEHMADPIAGLEEMLAISRNILFTTTLLPSPVPKPGSWWYYGLDHGQHVTFFTREALSALAARFGLHACSDGRAIHVFSERPINRLAFRVVAGYRFAVSFGFLFKKKSLLDRDYKSGS